VCVISTTTSQHLVYGDVNNFCNEPPFARSLSEMLNGKQRVSLRPEFELLSSAAVARVGLRTRRPSASHDQRSPPLQRAAALPIKFQN
jgi:hypothetical protein